ncbi:hypothetical protein ACFVFQ_09585 [Streptomyces sp. NPDC057743]|uniref:hypothetical protein n=1 Tax=Streptomyces sp. NPDC057743 TaxID=3346236 RepID=UPI003692909E
MTRTREFLAVAAITAAALGSAAVPAMADNHIPSAPTITTIQGAHRPMAPQDNHMPVPSQRVQVQVTPMDNHMP